jgi:CheY-like chemotaxis protein
MDHMMPEMDGVEATQAIRALGGNCAKVPIVALTANAVSGAKEMFLSNGFTDFLSKPMDNAELGRGLIKWLPESKISVL